MLNMRGFCIVTRLSKYPGFTQQPMRNQVNATKKPDHMAVHYQSIASPETGTFLNVTAGPLPEPGLVVAKDIPSGRWNELDA